MHGRRSGNNHFAQLEHWQHCLWQPLNLSLLFIRSSSSTGAHQCARWHTHTHTYLHTYSESQGHKVSVGASALWFLLSKSCKMEMRLNGWHGLSLSAACIIGTCSNTFDSGGDKTDIGKMLQPTYLLHILLIHPLPPAAPHVSARFWIVWSKCCPLLHFLTLSSHYASHFSYLRSLLVAIIVFFNPWLWLVFSVAHGNLIRPIKTFLLCGVGELARCYKHPQQRPLNGCPPLCFYSFISLQALHSR